MRPAVAMGTLIVFSSLRFFEMKIERIGTLSYGSHLESRSCCISYYICFRVGISFQTGVAVQSQDLQRSK